MAEITKILDGTRTYLVFDARAAGGDTDNAIVMEAFVAKSDSAAKRKAYSMWGDRAYVLYGATFKEGVAVQDETPLKKHWC